MSTQKHFSEAMLREEPRKKVSLQIKEGSVTLNKLGDEVKNTINSKLDSKDNLTYWNVNKIIFSAFGF